MGDNPATGFKLSASAFTAPQVTSVVSAAKVAPAEVPKRISLPSKFPKCWSTGKAAMAGIDYGNPEKLLAWLVNPGFGFKVSKCTVHTIVDTIKMT